MEEVVLKVENVVKTYTPSNVKATFDKAYKAANVIKAVDDVSFEVKSGEIYGLLGPNGAGKSTIIKMITGLVRKDSGKIYVSGHDIDVKRKEASSDIGAIIEMPALFKNMSAIDNLRYFATLQGGISEERIKSILNTVGLSDRARDKVGGYSLGMQQRLAIAQAIMGKPRLLILDEPTNGLDPQWIITVRELVRRLAKEYGMAVMVSSHILGEMQEMCDRVGIINKGKLMMETSVDEISKIGNNTKTLAAYHTSDPEKTKELVLAENMRAEIKSGRVIVEIEEKDIPELTKKIVLEGINLYGVEVKKRTLEELFSSIVSAEPMRRSESESNPFDEIKREDVK